MSKSALDGLKLRALDPRDIINEAAIERHLRKQCAPYGALVLKMRTDYKGFVDRIVLWPCYHIEAARVDFIELKRPKGGTYQPYQQRWHTKLVDMGLTVHVLLTKEAVNDYVSRRNYERPVVASTDTLSLAPIHRPTLKWLRKQRV